jgi:hypothetical protein
MPFPARSPRRSTISGNGGPIFGVGRQLFVNCPGGREDRTALLDDKGAVLGSMIDGAEVEVVAWVPRGTATRYFIRATRSELSGWLGSANLRTTRVPRSAEAVMKAAAAAAWIPPRPATALLKTTPRRARNSTQTDKTAAKVSR